MKYFYRLGMLLGLLVQALLRPAAAVAAPFTPGNIVIARVGDGTAVANGASAAVFLDEYTPTGTLVQSIALPTAVTGNNRILTVTPNGTSELPLTRTADGRKLLLAGYGAAPGYASVVASTAADVVRVVGVIGADGSVDTSTGLGSSFSGTNVRGVASADGSNLYVVGGNTGVQYVALGGANLTTLNTAPTNNRVIEIFGGSLYLTSGSSPYVGVSQVGTGLPTTAGQTVTLLPGAPGNTGVSPSPYGFYFADLSTAVAGMDVVYVTDSRTSSAAGSGIQKWSLVGGTWVLNGTIANASTSSLTGLDGSVSGTAVSLLATSATSLYTLTDNTGYNVAPAITTLPTAVATLASGSNKAFRGVSFAPVAPAAVPTITSFTPTSGVANGSVTVTVTGTDFTGATAVTLNGVAITGFTVVNATTITFTVPAGATSGAIAVTTAGGTATSAASFTVTTPNAAPTIASLSPTSAGAGSGSFTLMVTGTNFVTGTVINFNGTALATTYGSATQVSALVPAASLATAGSFPVTATNPAPGGGTSAAVNFTVTTPAPTITSFTPTSGLGNGTVTVTVTGTNFTGATAVTLNGVAVTGFTVVNATTLTFTVPSTATNGVIAITTPGGTATSTASFLVAPTISALSPTAQVVGGPALTLTITGTNFTAGSTVNFNNVSYTPTAVTATTATVTIPASVLSTLGSYPVSVTSGGGTSNVFTFVVSNPSTANAYETFEAGTKASYTTGPVTLSSGAWTFTNALIGDSFADKFNGVKSARIRTGGSIAMNFDKPNGAGTVIVNAALYGNADTGATFVLEQSTDGGANYTVVTGAPATLSYTLTPYTFTVNRTGNVRLRISNSVTSGTAAAPRINIDDIAISNYTGTPTLAANALPGLTVFPNPATDRLTVALPTAAPATVALRDLAGRLVLAPAALGADQQLRLPAALASGVYLLEVRQNGAVAVRRIEKR